ncbi:MAG: hypothetical protein EOR68_03825 [Mesorhizobium sp.]|uniref:hypothetical protein n=1 Tax=Mesorhizobium sp. TaxID=1871066 RepID=UPI000FE4F132|nr:hypothetical protein [Mesorhizobium sp.]RWM04345.1 MAG: hypothetical protein EOR68_03825 [Mesorhizobium sp.]TIP51684.1 MAG: hypothetical protein E5X77_00740 [Mesorhizobium sp.]
MKFQKWGARTMVRLAAFPGRRKLSGSEPIRILIDNSVLRHGQTHTNAWIPGETVSSGGGIPVELGHRARVPRNYEEKHKGIYENEVPFFAPLAHLAECGCLEFFTSSELIAERRRQRNYNRFLFGMNLWSKTLIQTLPDLPRPAIGRRSIAPQLFQHYHSKEGPIERLLATADSDFIQIAEKISRKNVLDFYHIWTAKHSNCQIFLTTDHTLKRALASAPKTVQKQLQPVRVLAPSELSEELGLRPVPHHFLTPLDADWFYEMRQAQMIPRK